MAPRWIGGSWRGRSFIKKHLGEELKRAPLKDLMETPGQIIKQDLEPDPSGGSGVKIKQEVAADRGVSVEELVLACDVTPANKPEEEAAARLKQDIEAQGLRISELHIDRGYIRSPVAREVLDDGGQLRCKPWSGRNTRSGLFAKAEFDIDMRAKTIACPMGQIERFELGTIVTFAPSACAPCPARATCTNARVGAGRTVEIIADDDIQQRLRKQIATPIGRERLRERVGVEHALAHIGQRQGRRARYWGGAE